MEIRATRVFEKLMKTDKRFVLSVGSSRSSKTYSMMQWIIIQCLQRRNEGIYISVVRSSFPSLRRATYREFVDMLKKYKLYSPLKHNRTEHVIDVAGNYVEFFSLNDSQKIRGAERNILYLNEVNEIDWESAQQLFIRTKERILMDMNPSDVYHWAWKMKDNDNVDYIHSTYLDNQFLAPETIAQIESYRNVDENFWRVYGLGLPGYSIQTIYTHWKEYRQHPNTWDSFCYGLDVGWSHAMVLVKAYFRENSVWVKEEIYQSALTSSDLIRLMKDKDVDTDADIWVDAAAPTMIEDLRRAGFNAKKADKSVKEGIDLIHSKELFLFEHSKNLIDEIKRYQWKMKNEEIIYEPVKAFDDAMDAMRYAIWNYYRTTQRNESYDFDMEIIF
jgi:phage terminase large subunit